MRFEENLIIKKNMNVKYFFVAMFFVSSFYKVTFGYSFHKTFKSPKEKYDELVEEKDKLEILERSNFSIEEDENEEQKSKDNTAVDSCPRATATAQVHVRFGAEHRENEKNGNIQHQFYEKRSLMFDPYIYQQFLYYMFLNGGQFGHHANFGTSNCGHYCNPHGRIPGCPNFHYCSCHSPNCIPSYDVPNYYNPHTHFLNSNMNGGCKTNNRNKKQLQNWDHIQNLPVKQLTKQELKLVLKYLDNEETEESKTCSEKLPIENNSKKITLEDSFAGPAAETPSPKKFQKRSISQNCKFPTYYKNAALKVTNNLEFVAVNISAYW